jgi:hypothetical protein
VRAILGAGAQGRIVGLRLADQPGVSARDHVAQVRVPVQAHGRPSEGIELPHQKIGEAECRDFVVMRGKAAYPFEKGMAMRPGRRHLAVSARSKRVLLARHEATGRRDRHGGIAAIGIGTDGTPEFPVERCAAHRNDAIIALSRISSPRPS